MAKSTQTYFCVYDDGEMALGNTLKEAYDNMEDYYREGRRINDCAFYVATPVEVEVKIVEQLVPVASK